MRKHLTGPLENRIYSAYVTRELSLLLENELHSAFDIHAPPMTSREVMGSELAQAGLLPALRIFSLQPAVKHDFSLPRV